MNRSLKRFSTLLTLFLLAGCTSASESQPQIPQIKIGLALYMQEDTFINSIRNHVEIAARAKEQSDHVKITINIADGRGNQSTQNEQVDRFLSQGYDVICVNEVDRTAASVIIDKARTAQIPVIFFNREPVGEDMQRWDQVYYVGSNPREAGMLQGNLIVDLYRQDSKLVDRNADGKVQYVMIEGEPGHQDAAIRTEYSVKMLTAADIEVEKLANDIANWQRAPAAAQMAPLIEQFGSEIEVVFCNNDDMALGVIDAYQTAQISSLPLIVGIDATPPALDAIRAGTLAGTVYNDAKGQGQAIFDLAYALATDADPSKAVPLLDGKYVWMPHRTITKETLDTL